MKRTRAWHVLTPSSCVLASSPRSALHPTASAFASASSSSSFSAFTAQNEAVVGQEGGEEIRTDFGPSTPMAAAEPRAYRTGRSNETRSRRRSSSGERRDGQQHEQQHRTHSGAAAASAFVRTPYTSSTPHHQTYPYSGASAATRLMQRQRASSSSPFLLPGYRPHSAVSRQWQREWGGRRETFSTGELIGRARRRSSSGVLVVSDELSAYEEGNRGKGIDVDAAVHTLPAPYARSRRYETFDHLFNVYVSTGFVDPQALLYHPEAPAPAVVLERILRHRTPSALMTERALLAIQCGHRTNSRSTSAEATFALQSVLHVLRTSCPTLYSIPSLRVLLVECLLDNGLYADAAVVVQETPDSWITTSLWAALVEAAAQSKLTDSLFLWRLLREVRGPQRQVMTRAGERALQNATATEMEVQRFEHPELSTPLPTVSECVAEKQRGVKQREATSPSARESGGDAAKSSAALQVRRTFPHAPFDVLDVHSATVVLRRGRSNAVATKATSGEEPQSTTTTTGAAESTPGTSASPRSSSPFSSTSPASAVALTNDDDAHTTYWTALASAEAGYAQEHYAGASSAAGDDRGHANPTGPGRLHVDVLVQEAITITQQQQRLESSSERHASQENKSKDMLGDEAHAKEDGEEEEDYTAVLSSVAALSEGVAFGLDAKTTTQLLLRAGASFEGQASPLLALNIMRRYLRTCELLKEEAARVQERVEVELSSLRAWHASHAAQTSSSPAARSLSSSSSSPPQQEQSSGAASLTAQENALVSTRLTRLQRRHAALCEAAQPHPSPFLVFFKLLRDTKESLSAVGERPERGTIDESSSSSTAEGEDAERLDAADAASTSRSSGTSAALVRAAGGAHALPLVHWELVWHYMQLLNRENPTWYEAIPNEAGDLCLHVIHVLCRGADPWLTLNVARCASARHIVDGLEMSLWLLHRMDASHHTEEAREVTRKVFRWLLVDVGVHLHPRLHPHLIPAARVLIRLGLQDELRTFYNAVLDNVYSFSDAFRDEFMTVMADLVCPSCSSILPDPDVYNDRSCPNCLTAIPAKDPSTLPSFQLSAEHVAQIRERRRAQRRKARHRLHTSLQHMSSEEGQYHAHRLAGRPPMSAAERFKREVLQGSTALIPGVSVSPDVALFQLEASGGDSAVLDTRAALEESSRRLQKHEAARRRALAQRGMHVSEESGLLASALLSFSSAGSALSSSRFGSGHQDGAHRLLAGTSTYTRTDGPWSCVWCQQLNSEWSSRIQCSACGAETGPLASWRQFAYAEDGDVMVELRARIANAPERPTDAVVAAYLLMVYRRAFLLRATPHDRERVNQLIGVLCHLHERVLAAYLYTRLIPAPARQKDENLLLLAQLFGGDMAAYQRLTPQDLRDDELLFTTVLTPETCKVCFGQHDWQRCPIVTRDFTSAAGSPRSSINLTPEEKQKAVLEHVKRCVEVALGHGEDHPKYVVDAYAAFVTSPFRELFAEVHAVETNQLSILLSTFKQYRRAAFVLCHVPLHTRWNESYMKLISYFNVSEAEAMTLLSKRSPPDVRDDSHPNFVQVAMTCCMCLDERHASFDCPRLHQWLDAVNALAASDAAGRSTSSSSAGRVLHTALSDVAGQKEKRRRLIAQVDGWTSAGPERLHAFYRFLLEHVDVLRDGAVVVSATASVSSAPLQNEALRRRRDISNPLVYALNKTITKLAVVGKRSYAYRLYARSPVECVTVPTTVAMLRMNQFTESGIRALLHGGDDTSAATSTAQGTTAGEKGAEERAKTGKEDSNVAMTSPPTAETTMRVVSEAARAAAVPLRQCCLLCFESGHSYFDCPELAAQPTLAERLWYVCRHVGGVCCTGDGISAAAAYVYDTYNRGLLSQELLRANPGVVQQMIQLASRCFATRRVGVGVRLLRRLPLEMVKPEPTYTELWRSAGLPEHTVEERRVELLALYDAEGLRPSVDPVPPRKTYTARFMSNLSHALHDGLCRHCFEHGHTLATCSTFHAEVSFGRDYVAAYRMSMMSEQLDRDWQDAYLLKLVDFFHTHRVFMPYHIVGVSNALNAISAMWSFRGEPGIALRHLLTIPPAYRRRQAFKHILHCLQVPPAEIAKVLSGFYFSPDDMSSHASGGGVGKDGVIAQHLLMPKPAIRDHALKSVFEQFPAAVLALQQSEDRMDRIRRRNAVPGQETNGIAAPTHTTSTSQEMERILNEGTSPSSSPSLFSSAVVLPGGRRALPAQAVMQSGDILRLREDFDPVLTELEDAVGMKLGSRHILFTSAVDIIAAAAASASASSSASVTSSTAPAAGAAATANGVTEGPGDSRPEKERTSEDTGRSTTTTAASSSSRGVRRSQRDPSARAASHESSASSATPTGPSSGSHSHCSSGCNTGQTSRSSTSTPEAEVISETQHKPPLSSPSRSGNPAARTTTADDAIPTSTFPSSRNGFPSSSSSGSRYSGSTPSRDGRRRRRASSSSSFGSSGFHGNGPQEYHQQRPRFHEQQQQQQQRARSAGESERQRRGERREGGSERRVEQRSNRSGSTGDSRSRPSNENGSGQRQQ